MSKIIKMGRGYGIEININKPKVMRNMCLGTGLQPVLEKHPE